MSFDPDNLNIRLNEEAKRFEVKLPDGQFAVIEYMKSPQRIIYTHTEVPEAYEGMGIASKMARAAMDYAREEGLKVQPLCPYVRSWVNRHPEYQDILTL